MCDTVWGWSDVRLISRWQWSARCSQCKCEGGDRAESPVSSPRGSPGTPSWPLACVGWVMLVSPDSGTKSDISILASAMVFVLLLDWMYFTRFLNSISLLIYWHSAWPVWPGNAPWQTDTPPPIIRCQLTGACVLRQVPGPGVSSPHSRCRPERHSVLSWLSPGSHLRHSSHTRVHTETRDTQGSQWRKLEDDLSFNLNKKDSYEDSSTIVLFVTNWMFQIVIE